MRSQVEAGCTSKQNTSSVKLPVWWVMIKMIKINSYLMVPTGGMPSLDACACVWAGDRGGDPTSIGDPDRSIRAAKGGNGWERGGFGEADADVRGTSSKRSSPAFV